MSKAEKDILRDILRDANILLWFFLTFPQALTMFCGIVSALNGFLRDLSLSSPSPAERQIIEKGD